MKKGTFIFIILGILIIPIIINYVLLIPIPFNFPIIGSNVDWLSFWGTYIGGIIGASVSFLILYLTLLHNKKEAEIERKSNQLLQLKRDLAERLSDINFMPLYIDTSNDINASSEIDRLNMLYKIHEQKSYTAKFIYENDDNELAKQFYKAYFDFICLFLAQINIFKNILTNKRNKDELKQSIEEQIKNLPTIQYSLLMLVNEAALKYYESEKEKLVLLKTSFL